MHKKMKKLLYMVLVAALTSSCGGFLDKYPNDQSYVNSVADLCELLLGEAYMQPTTGDDIGAWIHLMDDDIAMNSSNTTSRPSGIDFFWWEPYVETHSTWSALYAHINICNAVLDEIDRFTDDPEYNRVKGEALFLRGAYYWWLANLYAAPYNAATADSDMGVPLKLTSVIEDRRYPRASLRETYKQITDDLMDAVACLDGLKPADGNKYRVGEMAARMMLGRVWLYMGEWQKCVDECDEIIASPDYTLLDMTALTTDNDAVYRDSPETIFSAGRMWVTEHYFGGNSFPRYLPTPELRASYTSDDVRSRLFFRNSSGIPDIAGEKPQKKYLSQNGGRNSDFFMLRLPEAYLNRAESLAMLDADALAADDLETLRDKRLTAYNETITLTDQALVDMVRDERRREFCFEGQRWFDLRRYAVSPRHAMQKEIWHTYYETTVPSGVMVLGKYDDDAAYYMLPLPESEISLGGGVLKQNPARALKTPVTE